MGTVAAIAGNTLNYHIGEAVGQRVPQRRGHGLRVRVAVVRGADGDDRLERLGAKKGDVILETGYGPSGLPHIGTFGEVARTTMVRHAFRVLTDDKIKTRLIAFSDDMDGLRKVPDNVPNKEMLTRNLGMPLSRIPDPFGSNASFETPFTRAIAGQESRCRAF